MKAAQLIILSSMLACASGEKGAVGTCATNDECGAGEVCVDGACRRVCISDSNCSSADQICDGSTCVTCSGCRRAPEVTGLDASGSADGAPGHAAHHTVGSLVITGSNLEGAEVTLSGAGLSAPVTLAACGVPAPERLEVLLPEGITPDSYTLSVANQGGSCTLSATLLQGEPGPAGTYTAGDGVLLTGSILSVDFGSSAAQAARGDHTHSELLPLAGGTLTGDLVLSGAARLAVGGQAIARITACEYTGTVSQNGSQFYRFWQTGDCSNDTPRGNCVGFLSKAIHAGQDEDWRVLEPGDMSNAAGIAAPSGGMDWWCPGCAADGFKHIGAVYICDQ